MPNIAYVRGKWMELSLAVVSVEDRGFQFGDGVYELIRTYEGHIFHLEDHIKRLYSSARKVQIVPCEPPSAWPTILQEGCKRSGYKNVKIYIQITRGTAPRAHAFPEEVSPTTVCTFREFDLLPQELRDTGVSVISTEDVRWSRCDVKSLNLLPNVLARQQALESSAYEAIFVRQGYVWEGAGSNIFAVFGSELITPPAGDFVLAGVTRDKVLKLGKQNKLAVREAKLLLSDLYHAEEIFLTGTTVEVLSGVRLNRRKIGTGKPGPVASLLYQALQTTIQAYCQERPMVRDRLPNRPHRPQKLSPS